MVEPPIVDPTAGQTEASIGAYLRACPIGGEVAVRETQGGNLSFTLATIASIDPRLGRLYLSIEGQGAGAWFLEHGRSCVQPTGQSQLVEPTPAVRAFIKDHPRGVLGWYGSVSICKR